MTIAIRMTVAQEAQDFIEQGSRAIGPATPDRVLIYLARKYVEGLERSSQRERVRKLERQVAVEVRRSTAEVDAEIARKARRKAWQAILGKPFALGDSTATWGRATKAQHYERANAQRKLAKASEDDARLHELAIQDLSQYGVNCLADL